MGKVDTDIRFPDCQNIRVPGRYYSASDVPLGREPSNNHLVLDEFGHPLGEPIAGCQQHAGLDHAGMALCGQISITPVFSGLIITFSLPLRGSVQIIIMRSAKLRSFGPPPNRPLALSALSCLCSPLLEASSSRESIVERYRMSKDLMGIEIYDGLEEYIS